MQMSHVLVILLSLAAVSFARKLPSQVIDLTHWKLQLPVSTVDPALHRIVEIMPAKLASFQDKHMFTVDDDDSAVIFRARVDGVITGGTQFPRTELRELNKDGTRASWNIGDTTQHTMIATQAIHHVPAVKPEVVFAQIHDEKFAVLDFRLTKHHGLEVVHEGKHFSLLRSYTLGDPFTWKISASNGFIRVYFTDLTKPLYEFPSQKRDVYFKAGAYTQSNVQFGDLPDDFSEVWIFALTLTTRA